MLCVLIFGRADRPVFSTYEHRDTTVVTAEAAAVIVLVSAQPWADYFHTNCDQTQAQPINIRVRK